MLLSLARSKSCSRPNRHKILLYCPFLHSLSFSTLGVTLIKKRHCSTMVCIHVAWRQCIVHANSTLQDAPPVCCRQHHIRQHVNPLCLCVLQHGTYRCKTRDVINPHAIMSVQNSDLPPRADAQPVGDVLCCVKGEGMQQQQGQGKVIHKVALLGELDVGFILLMDLTQQSAASLMPYSQVHTCRHACILTGQLLLEVEVEAGVQRQSQHVTTWCAWTYVYMYMALHAPGMCMDLYVYGVPCTGF